MPCSGNSSRKDLPCSPCSESTDKPPCAEQTPQLEPSPSKRASFAPISEPKPSTEKAIDDNADKPRPSFELGPDEEVWIVQCPKTLDLRKLVGAKVKLNSATSKTSVKTDELSVDADTHQYSEARLLSVATPSGKIRKMDAVGSIKLKKRSRSSPNVSRR